MEQRITKLKSMIDEVPRLLMESRWNNNFELWKSRVNMLLKKEFGSEAFRLFDRQSSPDFMNPFAYGREVIGRKEILEGIITHSEEYNSERVPSVVDKVIQATKSGAHFEVGGNMINHGVIQTTNEAIVGASIVGDMSKKWYEKPVGIILIAVIAGLIIAGISFWIGWH